MTPHMLTRSLDRGATIFLLVVAAFGILIPLSNLLLPAGSILQVPTYLVALFGKYVCYAILALSIDLIWGYCGILSLGHGAFFALGGYAMGMYLMRQIGSRGVYGNPILPDFMVFLNYSELPWYWYGFDMFWFAALMVLVVPGLLAFCFGWLAFRSRVTGVYLSIITQAMTYALLLAFFRNDFGFGGNNGLTDFKDILGFNVQAEGTRAALFALSCLALIVGFLICRAVVSSKLGKVLIAIRDAESRTRFLGYRVEILQAVRVHVVGLHGRRCRRALRAAGRHHQPERIRAGQFDRGGDLGRGRRPRHADRRGTRRRRRQLRQNVLHLGHARAVLAVHAGRAVHPGDAAAAEGHRRHLQRLVGVVGRKAHRSQRRSAAAEDGVTEPKMAE